MERRLAKAKTSNCTFKLKGEKLPICQQCWNKIADQEARVVKRMENFSVNSAKSFIGKNVNLHLKDGAVIVNVQLTGIHKGAGKNSLIEYTAIRKP